MIDSFNKFKDYCLRALGQDEDLLIKVEVTDKQIEDRIGDALTKWQDNHFEGSTLVNVLQYITNEDQRNGYVEISKLNSIVEILTPNNSNKSNTEWMDDIEYRFHLEYADNHFWGGSGSTNQEMGLTDYYINREYLASMRYLMTADKLFTFNATSNRLYLQGKYSASLPPQLVEEFRLGNWVDGTGTVTTADAEELPNGKIEGAQIANTDAGANPISTSFTYETDYYPRGLRTFTVRLKQGDYTGRVILRVKDRAGTLVASKTVQPKAYWSSFEVEAYYKEGHINDFVFELESVDAASDQYFCADAPSGFRNNFIILVGYQTSSPDDIDIIWNSGWLKSYAIALLKKQWAQNLKKYDGVQMAGGVTLNAQAMFDEAVADIQALDEELETKWNLPPAMFIG